MTETMELAHDVLSLSVVSDFMWSVAHQAPLSQGYKKTAINILYMIKI